MMKQNLGDDSNGFSSYDFLGGGSFDSLTLADFGNPNLGGFDINEFGSTSIQSDGLDDTNLDPGSQGFDFELNDTENAIVRLAAGSLTRSRGRPATKKAEKIYITHEDFDEGPERDAFLLIYGYAENLFDTVTLKPFDSDCLKKERAINFFFCKTIAGIHMDDAIACIDAQIRVDVIRLRFMLEFWMRDWVLPPMPDMAEALPSRIELMAAQFGGMTGVALAREAWFEPGIRADQLLERICDGESDKVAAKVKDAFVELVGAYILSVSNGKVYTTGKNPILELEDRANDPEFNQRGRAANLHWSRKF